jgi:hypothetical protein
MSQREKTPSADRETLEALAEEFVERIRRGESPDIEEYARRDPDRADKIRELFTMALRLESRGAETEEAPVSITREYARAADEPPSRLGSYALKQEIGRGGMGRVFLAEHVEMRREVTLKVLPRRWASSEEAIVRFRREMRAAARLSHPHIVVSHDAGDADGWLFLAMEYVAGGDLAWWLKQNGPAPLATAVRWTMQAAAGLAHAHRHGIVHRDVKLSNLALDAEGNIKLLDLGLARFTAADEVPKTSILFERSSEANRVVGTPAFMAPEQIFHAGNVDARCDVYALGICLYVLLAGRHPFDESLGIRRFLDGRCPSPRSLTSQRSDLSPKLDAIVAKMIASAPDDRYPSMEAVVAELEKLGDGAKAQQRLGNIGRRTLLRGAAWVAVFLVLIAGAAAAPLLLGTRNKTNNSRVEADEGIAAWAIQFGAKLVVATDGREIEIDRFAALPEEPLTIVELDFPVGYRAADEDAVKLRSLKSLERLSLKEARNVDALLPAIRGMKSLLSLDLSDSDVAPASLTLLAESPKLHTLWLGGPNFTDAHLEAIRRQPSLHYLWLDGSSITDDGLSQLATHDNLGGLGLNDTRTGDGGIEHLIGLPRLNQLDLSRTLVTSQGLLRLRELPTLDSLALDASRLGPEAWSSLETLGQLRTLVLSDAPDQTLQAKGMKQLKQIVFNGAAPTADALDALRKSLPRCEIVSHGAP